jgi:long-subunit fatty acid transport protein
VPTQQQKGASFRPYVNLGATRQWTNLSLTGSLSSNQSPSAFGYVAQVYALSLNASYKFTERLSGSLSGSYSLSSELFSQNQNQNQNQTNNYSVNSGLSYQITEKLTASSGYTFSSQLYGGNNLSSSSNAPVQVGYLMLNYSYPLHYMR